MEHKYAFLISNPGLGDSIVLSGMVNYLATKYEKIYVACIIEFYDQIKLFYPNPNIIPYPINELFTTNMYEFSRLICDFRSIYDIYYLGNYGAGCIDDINYTKTMKDGTVKKIITDYPISYYNDVNIPIEYMVKYFSVTYPEDILEKYKILLENFPVYRVIHQIGSNASIDIIRQQNLDINEILTIDINKNLYEKNHAYYDICEKFINFRSIIFYAKLLENASELYLIDSCLHALSLIVNISKANPRICFRRESRFRYGIPNKFNYFQLVFYSPTIL